MPPDPDPTPLADATTELASGDRSVDRNHTTDRSGPPSFNPEVLLADRYRIVRFLARGGMGEVYEAQDLSLQMRIALKAIAPEVAADTKMIARLKREVLITRKVTHPNVCRLHDLGQHVSERGTIAFLTMDLLLGETLAAHVARKGRLTTQEAMPIVRQMASALDAAHRAGVIHRDLKTRNVMLVDGGPDTPPRAVVMDFGIAVPARADDPGFFETGEGRFMGTPAYMAPEQIQGAQLSPATDVYALGIVMFEMVTGTMPFESERALEILSARLTRPPPSPRSRVAGLDQAWNDTILRCLAREPERRYASAGEVVAALEAPTSRWTRGRVAGVLGAASLVAAAAFAGANHRSATAPPLEGKHRVAVVDLHSDHGELPWVGAALGAMIGTELAASEELRVTSPERVAQASRDLGLDAAAKLDVSTLGRLRANLGTDYVVAGTYEVASDGTVHAEAALEDAQSGKSVAQATANGSLTKLPDLAAALGGPLRARLGAHAPTSAQAEAARAATASDPAVLEAFSEGEAKLRRTDLAGARDALERAVAKDPSYALAHSALSEALWFLGEEPRSLEEAGKAFALSHGMSREQQLLIEARYRLAAKDWGRAAEIYRALVEFFPDNIDYGCGYARALDRGGKATDALAVLERLRRLPPPDGDDPTIDILDATISDHLGDEKRSLESARAAVPKAEARGQAMTAANAHRLVGEGLWAVDRVDEALVELQRARTLFEALGEKPNLSTTLAEIAGIDAQRGRPNDALPLEQHAVELVRQIGDRYRTAVRIRRVADAYDELGDVKQAHPLWEESRALFALVNDERGEIRLEGRLGIALREEGSTKESHARIVDARDRSRALKDREVTMEETHDLAVLAIDTGDLVEADRESQASADLARAIDDNLAGAEATFLRAQIAREKGDGASSRKLAEEARATFERVQGARGRLQSDLLLAMLDLDEGRAADAEALARSAVTALHAGGYAAYEASALTVLAHALVAQGKSGEATAAIETATTLSPQPIATQLDVELAHAAIPGASPDGGDERTALAQVRARAEGAGLLPRAWEARLATARDLIGSARARELATVAKEARDAGYERIAKLAR